MTSCMMQNSHEIREFVWLYDRIDIMESWTEELENKLIELQASSRMNVINNELTCLAQWLAACRSTPVGDRRRCVVEGVQSDSIHDSTQLNYRRRVELSYVAINGALGIMLQCPCSQEMSLFSALTLKNIQAAEVLSQRFGIGVSDARIMDRFNKNRACVRVCEDTVQPNGFLDLPCMYSIWSLLSNVIITTFSGTRL